MRASSLLGACGLSSVLAAGCALPERSNLHDPAKAPSATVRVLREQAPLLEAERQEALTIEVAVRDPQKNPLQVTLSLEDPRDEASEACPRFDPVDLGAHEAVSGSSLTLAWTVFPPPCFERASAEEPARMVLEVRAEIRDSAGYKAVATTPWKPWPSTSAGPRTTRPCRFPASRARSSSTPATTPARRGCGW